MQICNKNPIYHIIKNYLLEGQKEDSVLLIFFYSANLFSIDKKFEFLKTILENPFLKNSQILPHFWGLFQKIQRVYFAFLRVLYLWKFKRAKIYNTEDLFMNSIKEGQKGTIVLFENQTKYIFHIRELIQSIHNNLSNCSHFFPDIKSCKNPYTNVPFKKSNLYNIYFAIKGSDYKLPRLFDRFFIESFDLQQFSLKNAQLINEEWLEQYTKTAVNIYNIKDQLEEMFLFHKIKTPPIHNEFPKTRLIEIMLPYLSLYNKSQYYINTQKAEQSHIKLHNKLLRFKLYNPIFGRKKIHVLYDAFRKKLGKTVSFNDRHIIFENNNKTTFMTNHYENTVKYPLPRRVTIIPIQEPEEESEEEAEFVFEDSEEDSEEE